MLMGGVHTSRCFFAVNYNITAILHCDFLEDMNTALELGIEYGCGGAIINRRNGEEQFTADSAYVDRFNIRL